MLIYISWLYQTIDVFFYTFVFNMCNSVDLKKSIVNKELPPFSKISQA